MYNSMELMYSVSRLAHHAPFVPLSNFALSPHVGPSSTSVGRKDWVILPLDF
jgi:hypothetical protein